MSDGRIYYAEEDGNYYLKLTGDVRVTLCTSLSRYIDHIFEAGNMRSVVVDLSQAKAVDSTTLGFMAKVAIHANSQQLIKPLLITRDQSMQRLVRDMGFDDIFSISTRLPTNVNDLHHMQCTTATTDDARRQVIEAHRTLMGMNNKNMKTFSELVKTLEREVEQSL